MRCETLATFATFGGTRCTDGKNSKTKLSTPRRFGFISSSSFGLWPLSTLLLYDQRDHGTETQNHLLNTSLLARLYEQIYSCTHTKQQRLKGIKDPDL